MSRLRIPAALTSRAVRVLAVLMLVVISAGVYAATAYRRHAQMAYRLLVVLPNDAAADPALVQFARMEGPPLYARHCAACHGADMRGNPALGAPNLTDHVALYGRGDVYDIERTLLYGIRSGLSRSRDIAEMPAFGLAGTLSSGEISSLVQYLMQLSGRPYQAEQANEGREIFHGTKANCGDCHGADARGNPDYGAPDLTSNVWNSGGDPQSLYNSIYFGQHRVMPAWRNTLTLGEIRTLAVYLNAVAQANASLAPAPGAAGS